MRFLLSLAGLFVSLAAATSGAAVNPVDDISPFMFYQNCTTLAGNKCVSPAFQSYAGSTLLDNPFDCSTICLSVMSSPQSEWDGSKCYCSTTACTGFIRAPGREYWINSANDATLSCPALVAATPTQLALYYYRNIRSVVRGQLYRLQVTLTLRPPSDRRLEAATERELKAPYGKETAVSTSNFALLVTPPAGNAVTYRRTSLTPALKPGKFKKPKVQANGELLWPSVPMPQYATKNSTRTFLVAFRVTQAATSPLIFGASLWQDGNKLEDATPISLTVV